MMEELRRGTSARGLEEHFVDVTSMNFIVLLRVLDFPSFKYEYETLLYDFFNFELKIEHKITVKISKILKNKKNTKKKGLSDK